jgi:hypothetical protein
MLGTMCNLNHRAPDTTRNNPPQNPPQIGRVFEGVSGREAGKDFSWSPEKAEIELVEIRAQGGSSFAGKKEVERTCKFSHKILEKKKEDIETSGKVYAGVGSGEEANDRRRGRRDFQSRGAPLRLFLNLPQSRRKKNS